MKARAFAEEWVAAWNSRDLERILAHYADAVVFSSPRAAAIVGAPVVRGKAALRAYWAQALARAPDLHFELQDIFAGADCVSIVYLRNGAMRVCETMEFSDGLVVRGCVAHDEPA
ncbi:MAG: nuclear transport factor 2 family protein [Beijerinckiaceae bacterium]